jgi:adenylate cyclase
MSLKKTILDKVDSIINEEFKTEEVSYVPKIDNSKLTFGNTGLLFEATVLFIDMRGSTKVLNNHHKSSIAKIHMSYLYAVIKIARDLGGEIRSFNGDSMLVFFQGATKTELNKAVKAAMQMKYILSIANPNVNSKLNKYSKIDFGIGIDNGKILCTKIGIPSVTDNKDLVWIGNAVNKSTKLGDNANAPNNIVISKVVYDNLGDNTKYCNGKNMWINDSFEYNKKKEVCYLTNYHWEIS